MLKLAVVLVAILQLVNSGVNSAKFSNFQSFKNNLDGRALDDEKT